MTCNSWPRLRSRRCINSRGRINPSEFPTFLIAIFMASRVLYEPYKTAVGRVQHANQAFVLTWFLSNAIWLFELFQLGDHPLQQRQPAPPECRRAGVEPERLEQGGMMLGAAGRQHREIALGETVMRLFVDGVERVHQAIAERIGVDVERRVNEVPDIGPEGLVAGLELDRGPEAFCLHLEPDRSQPLRGELA